MSMVHFHLAFVHLPIVAIPLLVVLLLVGMLSRKQELSRTALIGVVLVALVTIPIFLTGEAAEELVEHLPSVSERQVENHEEVSTIAFFMVILTGLISLFGLVANKFKFALAKFSLVLTLILGTISSATLALAAYEGGKIRHLDVIDSDRSLIRNYGDRHNNDHDHDD